MKQARIPVVGDEQSIADKVKIIFNKERFMHVDVCYCATEAKNYISQ